MQKRSSSKSLGGYNEGDGCVKKGWVSINIQQCFAKKKNLYQVQIAIVQKFTVNIFNNAYDDNKSFVLKQGTMVKKCKHASTLVPHLQTVLKEESWKLGLNLRIYFWRDSRLNFLVKLFFWGTSDNSSYFQASIVLKQVKFMVERSIAGFAIYYIIIIETRLLKLILVKGFTFFGFMVLLIFDAIIFRCLLSLNCSSSIILRCFWDGNCETLMLLKNDNGWFIFFDFRLKMTSWACLLGFGLKFIFHRKTQLLILG